MLRLIAAMPFAYDYWQHAKWLYKEAEREGDAEVLGAMIARLDAAPMGFEEGRLAGQVGVLPLSATEDASIAVADGIACIASHDALSVVDIADASTPALIARFGLDRGQVLALQDGHAIVLRQTRRKSQLQVIDLQEPGSAACVGQLQLGKRQRINLVGWLSPTQVVLWLDHELAVLDVATPSLPKVVHQLQVKQGWQGARSIALHGGYLYVQDHKQIAIYDARKSTLQQVGKLKGNDLQCAGVCGGNLVVVSTSHSYPEGGTITLRVFGLDDPAKPAERAKTSCPGYAYVQRALGDFSETQGAFTLLAWNDQPIGQLKVDLSDPAQPSLQQRFYQPGASLPTASDDRYTYRIAANQLRIHAHRHPSDKTIGYMKRRARRHLRQLASEDAAAYVAVAAEVLRHTAGQHRYLPTNWVVADILYGGGKRLAQKRHGRGPVVLTPARWRRWRREERVPDAWDAAPGTAIDLLLRPQLAWPIHECVFRQLQMKQRGLPRQLLTQPGLLAEAQRWELLTAYLASPSPWLIHGAIAALNLLKTDLQPRLAELPPELVAGWTFYADGLERKAIAARVTKSQLDRQAFAVAFTRLLAGYLEQAAGRSSRRLADAAQLLGRYPDVIPSDLLGHYLPLLVTSGEQHVRGLGLAALRRLDPNQLLAKLPEFADLPEKTRATVLKAAHAAVSGARLHVDAILGLVYHDHPWCRKAGWRLLTAADDTTGASVWSNVLYSGRMGEALRSALTSRDAMQVLRRVQGQLNMSNVFSRVFELVGHLLPDQRNDGVEAMLELARDLSFSKSEIRRLLAPGDWWRQLAGWQFLAVSQTPDPLIAKEIERLLANPEANGADRVLVLPAVATLLKRLQDGHFLNVLLVEQPALLARLPAGVIGFVLSLVSADQVVLPILSAADEDWPKLREILLKLVGRDLDTVTFFHAVEQGLEQDIEGVLARRICEDEAFRERFLAAETDEVMKLKAPELDAWLVAWAEQRQERFTANSPALLTAATHPGRAFRDWGLARCQLESMALPFALRLLESELPEAVAHGKRYMDQQPSGSEAEAGAILALLDSPEPSVQAYGIELREERLAGAGAPELLRQLGEHGHPQIRTYVARQLKAQPPAPAPDFDRRVLRRRRYARDAKEHVKDRLAEVDELDVELLKELARGQCRRDADWAWQQLGRLAARGVDIEGITARGEAGI